MFQFSEASKHRLRGVKPSLRHVMNESLKYSPIDFGIPRYGGKRSAEDQNELYKEGASQLDGYTGISKHQEGKAVDIYAYVNGAASWDENHMKILAGVILSTAKRLEVTLRWGGDWDRDNVYTDQTFFDLVHYELVDE